MITLTVNRNKAVRTIRLGLLSNILPCVNSNITIIQYMVNKINGRPSDHWNKIDIKVPLL